MEFNGKEIICKPYYEEDVEVYKVYWTTSGRDEDGSVIFNEPHQETFETREDAEKCYKYLKSPRWAGDVEVDLGSVHMEGPIKETKKVYLTGKERELYFVKELSNLDYCVNKIVRVKINVKE